MSQLLSLTCAIAQLAREQRQPLSPHWHDELEPGALGGLTELCAALGWPAPVAHPARPGPDQFPLLAQLPGQGWAVATHWANERQLRLAGGELALIDWTSGLRFFHVDLPQADHSSGLASSTLAPGHEAGPASGSAATIIWRAVMRRRHVLVMAALATVCANVLTLATSLYSMQLYDRVIPLNSYSTLYVLTVGVVVALALDFVLRTVRAVMIEKEAAEIDAEISEYFFARAQSIRLDARPPGIGTMAAQLRGLEQVRAVMSSGSLFLVADLPFSLFFIVVIALLGGWLALVPVLSLPLAIGFAMVMSRIIRSATDRAQVSANRKNGLLVETLDAAEMIKANQGEWFMLARWNRLVRQVHHYDEPVKMGSAVASGIFASLQQLAYVLLMAAGAVMVSEGGLTAGALLACSIIAGRINGPLVAMLPQFIVQWGYARSSLNALDAILALPPDRPSHAAGLRPDALSGPVQIEALQFTYPAARAKLDIPRLDLAPGERIAVVGGVGSGKSTLLRLIAGLYAPQSGQVRIGGLNVAQVASDVVRGHIGYLPQDVRLVNATLRDNLTMGLGRLPDETILQAARHTGLDRLIQSHPQGLDLTIEEGGRGLSGGQRSLVGLTRMIVARPRIWLLDEPTASLDQTSETAVLAALNAAFAPQDIVIMVTHKLALLPRFGRVLLMADGKIAMDGPAGAILNRLQVKPPQTLPTDLAPAKPAGAKPAGAKPVGAMPAAAAQS